MSKYQFDRQHYSSDQKSWYHSLTLMILHIKNIISQLEHEMFHQSAKDIDEPQRKRSRHWLLKSNIERGIIE